MFGNDVVARFFIWYDFGTPKMITMYYFDDTLFIIKLESYVVVNCK